MDLDTSKSKTVCGQLPEERELSRKRAELDTLEDRLAELELDRATLEAEMRSFEYYYTNTVGSHYAELDVIEAEMAELLAETSPLDEELQRKAREAYAAAQKSTRHDSLEGDSSKEIFQPSEDLKKLYREIVKRIHPDLATSEDERVRRHYAMVQVNIAYEAGDEASLLAILEDLDLVAEPQGESIGEKLVRIIRRIDQAEKEIGGIGMQIEKLRCLELYVLFEKWNASKTKGRDLLVEIVANIKSKVASQRNILSELKAARGRL